MMPKIYILLPVHNRKEITRGFVECLKAQTFTDYHLVLIDDGSTDGTAEMVLEYIPSATVLRGTGDWWWAGGLQQGIDWLHQQAINPADIVLMTNDDVAFDRNFLEKAVAILKQNPDTLMLSQLQVDATSKPVETGVVLDWASFTFHGATSPDKINCLPTRGLFLRWGDVEKIGGFYPRLLPHYWSDYEFTLRAAKRGLKLATSPQLLISSTVPGTSQTNLDNLSWFRFVSAIFSKKTSFHPLHQYAFVLLACPWRWMPINLFRVTRGFIAMFVKQLHSSIKTSLQHQKIFFQVLRSGANLKVILGAAHTRMPGWISTNYPAVDITRRESISRHFRPGSVNAFLAEHVWEHLTPDQAASACRNCFELLAPGGHLRLAVPDGFHPNTDYIEEVRPGGTGPGADDHKVLYDYRAMRSLLESAGFTVKPLEYFDENGEFHYSEWSPDDGLITRSSRFDTRNAAKPNAYTSLIVDAMKPS